jgi:hypothetical protein
VTALHSITHIPRSKPLTKRERCLVELDKIASWIRSGHAGLREVVEVLQGEENFMDCTDVFATTTEDVYVDTVHFNQFGFNLFLERIEEYVESRW